jgi:hypothetical protein
MTAPNKFKELWIRDDGEGYPEFTSKADNRGTKFIPESHIPEYLNTIPAEVMEKAGFVKVEKEEGIPGCHLCGGSGYIPIDNGIEIIRYEECNCNK